MSEAAETGTSLWLVLVALYWAYLLANYERQVRETRKAISKSEPAPAQPVSSKELPQALGSLAATAETAFDPDNFLVRAQKAYEFILKTYAAGKVKDLADLLAPEVLKVFEEEIDRRKVRGEQLTLSFVAISGAEIVDKTFDAEASTISVRFKSEMFLSEGNGPSGASRNSARLLQAVDLWTFRRQHNSTSSFWILIATDTG